MILVQRSGALGDVILTTPVIRRLRRENPAETIAVMTDYPGVFQNNPYITDKAGSPVYDADIRHVKLDLAYERYPSEHIVQAYMLEAFNDRGDPRDLQQTLFYPKKNSLKARKCVAVHAAVAGWTNRTLPRQTWRAVVAGLRKAGLWPVLVGTSRDDVPDCDATRFFTADILATASLIDRCACFVGSDSAPLHIAGATEVPIAGVFTCARPETRLPWRHGELGWGCTAIVPAIDCTGCLARRSPPVTTEFCERGDTACVTVVEPDVIIETVIALTYNFR